MPPQCIAHLKSIKSNWRLDLFEKKMSSNFVKYTIKTEISMFVIDIIIITFDNTIWQFHIFFETDYLQGRLKKLPQNNVNINGFVKKITKLWEK